MIDVWKNIYAIIDERGLKKDWVANRAGYKGQSLATLRRSKSPRLSTLERIADALDVKVTDFFISGKG